MTVGSKVESVLRLVVDDVETAFKSRPDDFVHLANNFEYFSDLQDLVSHCKLDAESIGFAVSAAAVANLFHTIKQAILADDSVDVEELEIAKEVLSECLYRYTSLESYMRFEPLIDATEVSELLGTWENDGAWLGGNYDAGAILLPFEKLAMMASIAQADVSLFDRFIQVNLLIGKLIVASGGVDQSEREFLEDLKKRGDSERDWVVAAIRSIDDEPATQGHGPTLSDDEDQLAEKRISPEQALSEALAELEALVGLPEVKTEIVRLANFLKVRKQRLAAGLPLPSQSLHFVFRGNPGTGKTTVGRIISRLLYGFEMLKTPTLIETDRAGLVGGYVGQTAIKTAEVVNKAVDGVLFIDEAYTLSKNDGGNDFGQEAIDTILKQMEDLRGRLVVIAAGYPDLMEQFLATNPGLESRFTRFIHFDDYHVADLCQIFEKMCVSNSYSLTQEARANLAILFNRAYAKRDEKKFGNARFVRNVYEKTLGNHADRCASFDGEITRDFLSTIEARDLPFDMVRGLSGPFDVANSKWKIQCPSCNKLTEAGFAFLGNRVKCKCGARFRCPWWNLNPDTVADLSGFKNFDRPQDLMGYEAVSNAEG